jgi:hypothetical protein
LTRKNSLWICWCLKFLYNIVHGYGTHEVSVINRFNLPSLPLHPIVMLLCCFKTLSVYNTVFTVDLTVVQRYTELSAELVNV